MLALTLVVIDVPASYALDGPSPIAPGAAGASPGDAGVATTGVDADLAAVIEALRDELGESSDAMLRAAADLRLAETALPTARQTAADARRLLVTATRRQEEAARLRGQAQVRLMLSAQDAEDSAARVAAQQARIGRLARAAYQGGGTMNDLSLLLAARSPADFAERLVSLQTLATTQRTALDDLATVQQDLGTQTADLEQVRDVMAAADERAQRELATVAALEVRARTAEETVGRLVAAREAALAAARAAQAADDAAAARRDTISGRLQAELAARAVTEAGPGGSRDGATVAPRSGALTWPVLGRQSSPFGMRVHPITGVYKLHTGQDIAAPCGTPIRAAREGVVVDAGWNSAYGWRTVVSHGVIAGALLTTTYNHQQSLGVAIGDRVGTGQEIGTVGSTGYSTGCHLHVELYVNSTFVDPVPWFS